MTKCSLCGQGVNSTYVREGSKGMLRKIGYRCSRCDAYSDLTSEKLYTVDTKTVHSNFNREEQDSGSFWQNKEPWPGFGPGTFALPRQRSTRLSYQGTDILIRSRWSYI